MTKKHKKENLETLFEYHPPLTEERKRAHKEVNDAALEFAKVIDKHVKDEKFHDFAIMFIQQSRMMANQAITLQELNETKH